MRSFLNYIISKEFLETIIVLVLMMALLCLIKKYLIKRVAYATNTKAEQKTNTFIGMIFSVLQYLVVLGAIFLILTIHGIDVNGLLAGLGIVATIVGLALQDTFKDILSGINIYNNNFYKVNDIVKYDGEYCEVKYFNARVTKFRNVWTDASYTVCNSNITAIEKVKSEFFASLIMPFDADEDVINKCLNEFREEALKIEGMKNCITPGCYKVGELGDYYALVYFIEPKIYFGKMCEINGLLIKKLKKYNLKPVNEHHRIIDMHE